jgi:hypothetical protein
VDVDRQLLWVPAENVKGRFRSHRFALHQDTTALIRRSLFWPRRFLFPLPVGLKQSPDHLRRLLRAAHLPSDRKHLWHCLRRTAESHAAAAMGIEWAAAAVGHTVPVAKRSYIAPAILGEHRLCDVLPRPAV